MFVEGPDDSVAAGCFAYDSQNRTPQVAGNPLVVLGAAEELVVDPEEEPPDHYERNQHCRHNYHHHNHSRKEVSEHRNTVLDRKRQVVVNFVLILQL